MDNETQTPIYHSPLEVFEDYGAWFAALCLRFLRRYSDRAINDFGSFAPETPSLTEIIYILANKNTQASQNWLDSHDVPTLERSSELMAMIMSAIHEKTEATFEAINGENLFEHLPGEGIRQAFGLEAFELDILMVLALIQYDDKYARLWRFVSGASEYAQLNASYIYLLFDFVDPEKLRSALSEDGRLCRNALINFGLVPNWKAETPRAYAPIYIPKRVLAFLQGEHNRATLPGIRTLRNRDKAEQRPSPIEKTLTRALQKQSAKLALIGYSGIGRTTALCRVAQKLGLNVLETDLHSILKTAPEQAEISTLLLSLIREARLQKAILLFRMHDLDAERSAQIMRFATQFNDLLQACQYLRICVAVERQTTLTRELFGELTEIEFPQPEREDQLRYWQKNLAHYLPKEEAEDIASEMAEGYCLSDSEISTAIDQTCARLAAEPPRKALTPAHLTDTLNKTRGAALEGLATLRSTTLKLSDVVLSDDIRRTLNEILSFARYRDTVMSDWGFAKYNMSGAGLSVLLSGLPGTGKTMTAQVLAHELKRALYVIDLSRVVDKYIGETEKRLSKIFDEAERSQAMLLFDEADSLFAKRTNVKSSNDRYANLEVNYLLQRLEAYSGVSILTTNFADGLDEALARRIQFKIDFPMPDAKQREMLWKRLLPPKAPLADDIDFEALSLYFEMSGGYIKNAVFRASIEAASNQTLINYDLLWNAAMHEYRSMGHIIRDDPRPNLKRPTP